MSKNQPREIGMSCWPWGNRKGCDAQFNITQKPGETDEELERRLGNEAGKAGWCIGLSDDAQAYYVCPEHKNCVFAPVRLNR